MANTLLTASAITREALRVLHQKAVFIGQINRAYDDQFAKDGGAKIGTSLRIRLPNEYVVRTGATLAAQDTTEQSVTLDVTTQKGVDLNFTSADLTMSLDDFSKRIIEPAMAKLSAAVEADALTMALDVPNVVNNIGSTATLRQFLLARKALEDNLAPSGERSVILNTTDNVDLVDALKGLFNSKAELDKQYKEGYIGRTAGFDFMESTLLASQATGTAASTYLSNGATQSGATIVVDTGVTTFKRGDVVTFAGVFGVHPESKASTGVLKQFVITADYAGGAGSLAIAPTLVASGATQNASSTVADNSAVVKIGGASATYNPSLAFHKDAFTFATADLLMPKGVDMAARHVVDGISMRLVRQYDINNDKFPCRLDVFYGYKTIRPQHAVRVLSN